MKAIRMDAKSPRKTNPSSKAAASASGTGPRMWGMGRALLLATLLAFAVPAMAAAEPTLEQLLSKAETIRSGDPVAFRQVLREINGRASQADKGQKAQIEYLNAYAMAFSGRFNDAIKAAQKLLKPEYGPDMQVRAGALIVNNFAGTRQFVEGLRQLEETLALLPQATDPSLRILSSDVRSASCSGSPPAMMSSISTGVPG